MTTSVYECNEKADLAIAAMVTCVVGTGLPTRMNWALTAQAMGAGAAAIGKCYGIELTTDEGGELIRHITLGTGVYFLAMNVGSNIIAALIDPTGFGKNPHITVDAVTAVAFAWAIGAASKEYFQREYLGESRLSNKELGMIFRETYKNHKNK